MCQLGTPRRFCNHEAASDAGCVRSEESEWTIDKVLLVRADFSRLADLRLQRELRKRFTPFVLAQRILVGTGRATDCFMNSS